MRAMTRSVRPCCLQRRTSLIRRIDNLWVGIGLPHRLNEKPVARLSCRPKRLAPQKSAHDRLKSLLTIPRNPCSRCTEIRAHDPAKRASVGGGSVTTPERLSSRRCPDLPRRENWKAPQIPVSYTHLRAHETDSYLVC